MPRSLATKAVQTAPPRLGISLAAPRGILAVGLTRPRAEPVGGRQGGVGDEIDPGGGRPSALPLIVVLLLGLACRPGPRASDGIREPDAYQVPASHLSPLSPTYPKRLRWKRRCTRRQGLSVVLRSTGGGNAASLVAAGNDQVGMSPEPPMCSSRGAKSLTSLRSASICPRTRPLSLVLAPIRSKPQRVARQANWRHLGQIYSFALLQALLKANNLGEQDVKIVLMGAGDLVSSVMGQQVDAIAAFETTNVPAIRAAGGDTVSLRFADLGLRVPGNVYIANGEFARTNPDLVARFLAGTIRGWEDVQKDGGKEGLSLLVKAYPELAEQQSLLAQRWEFREQNNYDPYGAGRPTDDRRIQVRST